MTRSRLRLFGIMFLVWGLAGIAAFFAQRNMNLAELAKHDPYQAQLFAAMPIWVWSAYAVAVFTGFVGSILLLLRRMRVALWLYVASLVGVVAQFGYTFLATDILAVKGWSSAIFPAIIFLIAVAEICVTRHADKRGLLVGN